MISRDAHPDDVDQAGQPGSGVTKAPLAGLWSGVLLTIGVWLTSRLVVGIGTGPARNPFSFDTTLWAHWDTSQYLRIAAYGPTFGRCGSKATPGSGIPFELHLRWCGTAGWLPGYPWAIRVVHTIGLSSSVAGLIVSWIAVATAIFLVWFGWARDLSIGRAFLLLLLFALFPGAVYNFAIFPTSLALAAVVGAILAASRQRFLTGAILMVFGGLCYPSAWFAAAGLAIGIVLLALSLGVETIVRRTFWGLAGLASVPILEIVDYFTAGRSDAYFVLVGEELGYGPSAFQAFLDLVFAQKTNLSGVIGPLASNVLAIQAYGAIALAVASAAIAICFWRRKDRQAAHIYPALVGITVIVGLLVTNNTSTWYRGVVLAAPCVVCLRRIPMRWLIPIVAIMGTLTAIISPSFFNGRLI